MPTAVVPGTSLLQIIFVAANVTFLQAYTNHTVDAVLALRAAGRRRDRGADRHPLRHAAARRAAAFPAGPAGARGRREARLRPDACGRPACSPSRRQPDERLLAPAGGRPGTLASSAAAALLWLVAACCSGGGAGARRCGAGRSQHHIIAIGGGFTGASVVLFGATDGPGDIIAVVRGPEREMTVWRKGKVAGIWVNAESVTFTNRAELLRRRREPADRRHAVARRCRALPHRRRAI